MSITVARSAQQREASYRLRHDVYFERGFIEANDDRLDRDAYDDSATILLARAGGVTGEVVGTLRLIGQRDGLFLHERLGWTIPDWAPRDTVVEVSRWIAKPSRLPVSLVLARCVERICQARGLQHVVCNLSASSYRSLSRGGWTLIPCGEPQRIFRHAGSETPFSPFVIPVPAAKVEVGR